ncbi:hypothetical protein KQX54_021586 [Cotesia glomerata]|uniref:Uncharacterized protein n=1 Tax=Cotesia glomerata TaxID=32391 RepID=A0AAV7J7T8_COTGL|nr:hypothetical protein KQX54_021586 [Cotesia glomerata]
MIHSREDMLDVTKILVVLMGFGIKRHHIRRDSRTSSRGILDVTFVQWCKWQMANGLWMWKKFVKVYTY